MLRLAGLVAFAIAIVALLAVGQSTAGRQQPRRLPLVHAGPGQRRRRTRPGSARDLSTALTTPGIKLAELQKTLAGLAARQDQAVQKAQELNAPGGCGRSTPRRSRRSGCGPRASHSFATRSARPRRRRGRRGHDARRADARPAGQRRRLGRPVRCERDRRDGVARHPRGRGARLELPDELRPRLDDRCSRRSSSGSPAPAAAGARARQARERHRLGHRPRRVPRRWRRARTTSSWPRRTSRSGR